MTLVWILVIVFIYRTAALPPTDDFVIQVPNGSNQPDLYFKPIVQSSEPITQSNGPISSESQDPNELRLSITPLTHNFQWDISRETHNSDDESTAQLFSTPESNVTLTPFASNSTAEQDISKTPVTVTINVTSEALEPFYNAVYKKTLMWLSDTYTLSILIPIAAGFVFAAIVIVVVATCRCIRRKCCRRRLRRKSLSEAIKNMKASDRAKLLAESSDEEL